MSKTYVNDVFKEQIFTERYKGSQLIPSNSALTEMCNLGIELDFCVKILEEGYEKKIRAQHTTERWLDRGKKTFNIVIVRSYNYSLKEDVYLITHIGRFTRRK